MELFWYLIIALVLAIFFILDGYNFGTGIIHLFFAKTEKDKAVIAKSAGLFWDFNEVWLVAGGGLLFMAFPTFYASIFSGFYLPLIIVLLAALWLSSCKTARDLQRVEAKPVSASKLLKKVEQNAYGEETSIFNALWN